MAQFKELLEKEELEHIKEVKEDIRAENSGEKGNSKEASVKEEPSGNVGNSGKINKTWIWVAAIVAAVLILK